MNNTTLKIIINIVGVACIISAILRIPNSIYVDWKISFIAIIIGIFLLEKGGTWFKSEKQANGPFPDNFSIKDRKDPKLKETITLLGSENPTDRLLGIKFLHEITKLNKIKYDLSALNIFLKYLEIFSKKGLVDEVQSIISIIFNKNDETYYDAFTELKTIEGCDFSNLSFADAMFKSISFKKCIFNKTNFEGSIFNDDVFFERCEISQIKFKNQQDYIEYDTCIVTDVDFTEVDIELLYMDGSTVKNCDFSSIKSLLGATIEFTGCTIDNSKFNNNCLELYLAESSISNSEFNNSEFKDAEIEAVEMTNVQFENTTYRGILRETVFTKVSLKQSQIIDGSISFSKFSETDFTGLNIENTSIIDSEFNHEFTMAKLDTFSSNNLKNSKINPPS